MVYFCLESQNTIKPPGGQLSLLRFPDDGSDVPSYGGELLVRNVGSR